VVLTPVSRIKFRGKALFNVTGIIIRLFTFLNENVVLPLLLVILNPIVWAEAEYKNRVKINISTVFRSLSLV
jgi:hypothetical protein